VDEKTSNMKTAFGLDLAGYSGGNTGFARADVIPDDRILVTVYDGHPFATKRQRLDLIVEHSALEWEWVSACCQRGMLLVDVPIDMQGLPYPHNITFTWELTMRPVDVAFGAMPPFADRIGAPAARFQYVMNAHQKKLWHTLGTQLYETYPAASLALLKPRKAIAYKSTRSERAIFGAGQWNDTAVARLAHTLHLVADDGEAFTHDELDAAICAITGVVEEPLLLQGDELAREIASRLKEKVPPSYAAKIRADPPDGYVLLKEWPQQEIRLTKRNLATSANPLEDVIA
jgi:hypothetical protein